MDLIYTDSNLPDPIIDPKSGLAINHPVTIQNYPLWWEKQPDLYQHILAMREAHGIEVDDQIDEWKAAAEEANAAFRP